MKSENKTILSNSAQLYATLESIKQDGADKLHFLADFDRTLTKAFVDGERTPGITSILSDGSYLTSDYAARAWELFNYYHPIEVNPEIPLEERKKAMDEWWQKAFDLMIECGLNKKDLEIVAKSTRIQLREGACRLFDRLEMSSIPLVIMSASGLGGDVIGDYISRCNRSYSNINIVSNSFNWDSRGNAISVVKPIVHSMNKDETLLDDLPFFAKIKDRKNIILLGDNLEDVDMATGFPFNNIIKIGFLNDNVERNLPYYKEKYDIIITNDGSMEPVNSLLQEIL